MQLLFFFYTPCSRTRLGNNTNLKRLFFSSVDFPRPFCSAGPDVFRKDAMRRECNGKVRDGYHCDIPKGSTTPLRDNGREEAERGSESTMNNSSLIQGAWHV